MLLKQNVKLHVSYILPLERAGWSTNHVPFHTKHVPTVWRKSVLRSCRLLKVLISLRCEITLCISALMHVLIVRHGNCSPSLFPANSFRLQFPIGRTQSCLAQLHLLLRRSDNPRLEGLSYCRGLTSMLKLFHGFGIDQQSSERYGRHPLRDTIEPVKLRPTWTMRMAIQSFGFSRYQRLSNLAPSQNSSPQSQRLVLFAGRRT